MLNEEMVKILGEDLMREKYEMNLIRLQLKHNCKTNDLGFAEFEEEVRADYNKQMIFKQGREQGIRDCLIEITGGIKELIQAGYGDMKDEDKQYLKKLEEDMRNWIKKYR